MLDKLLICVFSYNRGVFLKNCVNSIERNINGKNVVVFDDNSSCLKTKSILNEISKKHMLMVNEKKSFDNSLKGLYHNMNKALEYAINKEFQFMFFIQDDVQVVRRLDDNFIKECMTIFDNDSNVVQINPTFFRKTGKGKRMWEDVTLKSNNSCYYSKNFQGICDIGIIKVLPLKEINWCFENGERKNKIKGGLLGFQYVRPKNPIMNFLPWPKTYKNYKSRKEYLFNKASELICKAGFYPYRDMTYNMISKLISRDINVPPYADDYLELETSVKLKQPWEYGSSLLYLKNKIGF